MVENYKRWWVNKDSSSLYLDSKEENTIAEWNVSKLIEKD